MKRKVRLIFTGCKQDGPEHWSQVYKSVDTEVELPEKIWGIKSETIGDGFSDIGFVGLEWLEDG